VLRSSFKGSSSESRGISGLDEQCPTGGPDSPRNAKASADDDIQARGQSRRFERVSGVQNEVGERKADRRSHPFAAARQERESGCGSWSHSKRGDQPRRPLTVVTISLPGAVSHRRRRMLRDSRSLLETFGVARLSLFGSFARDEGRQDSNVDLLVKFRRPIGFELVRLQRQIGERLGRSVELVTPAALRPQLRHGILAEAVVAVAA
jgi:uncharacterized protein